MTRLRAAAGVDDVVYDRDVLRRVLLTVTTVRRVVTTLAALLALAAFAAVAAVLRLGYYARRDEIDVLGLIGAPPRAISGPFVAEGMFQAAAGTVLALVLLRVAVWAVGQGPASAWARALRSARRAVPDVAAHAYAFGGDAAGGRPRGVGGVARDPPLTLGGAAR